MISLFPIQTKICSRKFVKDNPSVIYIVFLHNGKGARIYEALLDRKGWRSQVALPSCIFL